MTRPRRRNARRGRSGSPVAWVVGTFLGLCLLVAVVLAVRLSRDGGGAKDNRTDAQKTGDAIDDARNRLADPADGVIAFDAGFPPPHWTHQDFANFLAKQGVVVEIQQDGGLRSSHGVGVWFVDTRDLKRGSGKGRLRVYRCPTQRDALRQVAAMRPEVWLPYAAGNFAIGFDSKDNPSDEDLDFSIHLKGAFFKPR